MLKEGINFIPLFTSFSFNFHFFTGPWVCELQAGCSEAKTLDFQLIPKKAIVMRVTMFNITQEGMGNAIAQREQTVVVNGDTSVSSQPDLNTKEELAAGLAEGTSELADELDREADSTKVMIKVHAGTPIGILFIEPVLKDQ